MAQFSSRPLKPSIFLTYVRKHPFLLFGLPFLGLVVGSSFALQTFTQTRYDYHKQKVSTMSWEEQMGMREGRKKVDLREEYYVRRRSPSFHDKMPDCRN
jgi:cytochrome c oxidase assembly protein subunit 16